MARLSQKCSSAINPHTKLVEDILLCLSRSNHIRVWKNNTGVAKVNGGGVVRYGLTGSSDIIGICGGGKFLAIEVKTGNAKQSKEQCYFQVTVERLGGIYILARSLRDVEHLLLTAKEESL